MARLLQHHSRIENRDEVLYKTFTIHTLRDLLHIVTSVPCQNHPFTYGRISALISFNSNIPITILHDWAIKISEPCERKGTLLRVRNSPQLFHIGPNNNQTLSKYPSVNTVGHSKDWRCFLGDLLLLGILVIGSDIRLSVYSVSAFILASSGIRFAPLCLTSSQHRLQSSSTSNPEHLSSTEMPSLRISSLLASNRFPGYSPRLGHHWESAKDMHTVSGGDIV